MSYTDHNDTKGRQMRLLIQSWREERARRRAVEAEVIDLGAITLYMSKQELQTRLREASRAAF